MRASSLSPSRIRNGGRGVASEPEVLKNLITFTLDVSPKQFVLYFWDNHEFFQTALELLLMERQVSITQWESAAEGSNYAMARTVTANHPLPFQLPWLPQDVPYKNIQSIKSTSLGGKKHIYITEDVHVYGIKQADPHLQIKWSIAPIAQSQCECNIAVDFRHPPYSFLRKSVETNTKVELHSFLVRYRAKVQDLIAKRRFQSNPSERFVSLGPLFGEIKRTSNSASLSAWQSLVNAFDFRKTPQDRRLSLSNAPYKVQYAWFDDNNRESTETEDPDDRHSQESPGTDNIASKMHPSVPQQLTLHSFWRGCTLLLNKCRHPKALLDILCNNWTDRRMWKTVAIIGLATLHKPAMHSGLILQLLSLLWYTLVLWAITDEAVQIAKLLVKLSNETTNGVNPMTNGGAVIS